MAQFLKWECDECGTVVESAERPICPDPDCGGFMFCLGEDDEYEDDEYEEDEEYLI
jgi:hypothetical protein